MDVYEFLSSQADFHLMKTSGKIVSMRLGATTR